MKLLFCLFVFSNLIIGVNAQSDATLAIRSFKSEKEIEWMKEYRSFLSIPNIAEDAIGLKQNSSFIMEMMKKRNIQQVKFLNGTSKNVAPSIYGEVIKPRATKTIIFYSHYDWQPVDSSQSRSASDDKAGIMAIISAYEAIVKTEFKLQYNIKLFFEGEEEAGSTHLSEIFLQNESLLQSEGWVICNGPVHQSGNKYFIFGVRGDAHVSITVYGPSRPLHNGHYGNWAPNPGLMLAQLLSLKKDEKGRITIKGFYDETKPLTSKEQKAISNIPPMDDLMKKELKFLNEEMEGVCLEKSILMPSLNINGMQSGNFGKKANNVIPITASVVQSTTNESLVLLQSMGGSLALFLFDKYLKAKTITVPIAIHDNNQHADNENIRIRNL